MNPFNVIALFCEDLREEKDSVVTLIGIIPDNVRINRQEGAGNQIDPNVRTLTKLCLYVRINFDPNYDLPKPQVRLVMPDDSVLELGSVDAITLEKAKTEAIEKNIPLAGVILKGTLTPFILPKSGIVRAEVTIGADTYLAGALNFRDLEAPAIASNGLLPPS